MKIEKVNVPLDSELPFNFFNDYLKRKQYGSPEIGGYHWHESFEIARIVDGSGKYIFKDRTFDMNEGDIIVVNNMKPHFFDAHEDMHLQIIAFVPSLIWSGSAIDSEYLLPFLSDDKYYFSKVCKDDLYYEEIFSNFNMISAEFFSHTSGYRMAVKAHLQLMLTYFIRNIKTSYQSKKPGHKNCLEDIERVQKYIEENFHMDITLSQAANMVHLTTQYFSTFFKKTTGMTYVEYLNRYRIHKALELICDSELKITQIAANCGFSSITHFNRVFKQYTGKTPSNFKNNR